MPMPQGQQLPTAASTIGELAEPTRTSCLTAEVGNRETVIHRRNPSVTSYTASAVFEVEPL